MSSKIKTLDELKALSIGSEVYLVEKNEVYKYTICCHHPNKNLELVLISYGTNQGCTKWLGEFGVTITKIYTDHTEAVNRLISDIESDLEAIKRIYLKQ